MTTRVQHAAVVVAVAVLAAVLHGQPEGSAAPAAFAAGFDGDVIAVSPQGDCTPRIYGAVSYVPGVVGQAVVLGGPCRLVYGAPGGMAANEGTLSVWAKPLDWTPVTDRFVFFAALLRPDGDRLTRLLLYKVYNRTSITLLAESGSAEGGCVIHAPAASWRLGEWRHLMVTWGPQGVCTYVNGEAAAHGAGIPLPATGWSELVLGTAYPSWAYVGQETTAFDDLAIASRALSAEEVRERFAQALRRSPSLAARFAEEARRRERRREANLARAGGFVLASSFADYSESYPDNLLDGDVNSLWRPKEAEFPQWLELHWRYPVRIDRIAFEEVPPYEVTALTVSVPRGARTETVATVAGEHLPAGPYKEIRFAEQTTDRLRVTLTAGTAGFPQLAELEVFGPPQPLVGQNEPYWEAWYIWYPEADRVHKANAPRYFRKTFTLADPAALQSAFVLARSNDYYRLFLNGREVAGGATVIQPVAARDALRPGLNVIAAVADLGSNPGQWGWGEFLAELSLNYPDRSDRIGTDATWRAHDVEVPGWLEAGFDDSGWQAAAPYVRPPGGPWGRIPYVCTAVRERARVQAVRLGSATAAPGDHVRFSADIVSDGALHGDYFFVVDLGETAVQPQHGDFSVVRAVVEPPMPSTSWQPGIAVSLTAELQLPDYAPGGHLPVRLRGLERHSGVELELRASQGQVVDVLARLAVSPMPVSAAAPAGTPRQASLSFDHGQGGLRFGDVVHPPLFWRYCPINSFERSYRYAAGTGIHLHHFMIYPHVIDLERESWRHGFAELDQNITGALRVDPQADLMVLVDLRPTNAWLKAYPDERLVNGFGRPGPVSFASRRYEEEVHAYLRALIAFLREKPYYGRVMAIKPMTCGVPDSGLGGVEGNTWQADRAKLSVGDFNPQAIAAFRDWLRRKYNGDVARLQKAWKDPAVTFETAAPEFRELLLEGENGGVFRDPTKGRMPFDYFEFLPGLLGRFYQRLARLIKEETDGRVLVMIHYGYVIAHLTSCNNPGGIFQNNNFDFPELLQDPNLDVYLGAPDYGHRRAGDPYTLYFPVDSIALHRRLYIADGDYRTFVAAPVIHGRQRSARETAAVLQKDLASCIIGNSGTWFADMSVGAGRSAVGFFLEDSILETIRQMREVFDGAMRLERAPTSQVAVFVSTSTPKYHDAYYASTLYRNLIVHTYWRELHRLGAPFDCYLMSDLGHPDLRRDYRLYVFLNPFAMSAEERREVEALKRDGRTLLWFYAPGYVDDERGLSPAQIGEVTGIQVVRRADRELMRALVSPGSHPITAGLKPDHAYAVQPFGYPQTDRLHPTAFGPVFQVNDPAATTLATYADGAAAFAVRDLGSWRSVYMALPCLDAATLRNIARLAGVHLYCERDVVLDADNRFVMVHNGYDGELELTVRLPVPRRVSDALSGELLGENADTVPLKLPECTTRILRLTE